MAALDFPAGPAVNDTHTQNGRTWRWNGESWIGGHGGEGSAGGGSAWVHPDTPPSSPNAADDEFDTGSSIGGSWTALNVSNLTNSVDQGGLVLEIVAANAATAVRGYHKAISGSSWKYRTKLGWDGDIDDTTVAAGLFLRESGTGKLLLLITGYSAGNLVFTQSWTDETTFGSAIASRALSFQQGGFVHVTGIYLEIEESGSNYLIKYSFSGRRYFTLATVAKTTPFTTAADQVGLCMYNTNGNNQNPAAVFEFFRKAA